MVLTEYCPHFHCYMQKGGCGVCANYAAGVIHLILEYGETLYTLSHVESSRFLICSRCPSSGIDPALSQRAFRGAVDEMVRSVSGFDETLGAVELRPLRDRERWNRYYARNASTVSRNQKIRDINKRIEELKGGMDDTCKDQATT